MIGNPPLLVAVTDDEAIDPDQRLLPDEVLAQWSAIDPTRGQRVEVTARTDSGSSLWRVVVEAPGAKVTITTTAPNEPDRTTEHVAAAALVPLALAQHFDLGDRGPAPRQGCVIASSDLDDWPALAPHVDGLVVVLARPDGEATTVIAPGRSSGYLVGVALADHDTVTLIPATGIDVWLSLSQAFLAG